MVKKGTRVWNSLAIATNATNLLQKIIDVIWLTNKDSIACKFAIPTNTESICG
jgi:hypothetical protein